MKAMNEELHIQEKYWDRQIKEFDSIYSHQKSWLGNLLDKIFRWDMYDRFAYTFKMSEPIAGKSILDVGCGTGRFSLEYARRGAEKIVGLDIAPNMLSVCQERAAQEGLDKQCTFIRSDLLNFSSPDKFDICIGIGLFDYIGNPLPVVSAMAAFSKDIIVMSFPRSMTWQMVIRKIRLILHGCPVYFYSRKKVTELLSAAGLKNYEIVEIGQLYCVTAKVG